MYDVTEMSGDVELCLMSKRQMPRLCRGTEVCLCTLTPVTLRCLIQIIEVSHAVPFQLGNRDIQSK